ncbi:MAG: tetratricopeptide repeat protein [Polyangiaceae bacterium]|nr:tetratricopeptide repeat protein [Polyangiaceae bacterium]
MGLFDRLFKRPPDPDFTPDALRERLFDAVDRGDLGALDVIAERHEATILEHFAAWKKVPEAVRRDPAAMQRYAGGLIGIAQRFARRGNPALLQALIGPPGENPIERWQQAVQRAGGLMADLAFDEAAELLAGEAERARRLSGGDSARMLSITLGRLAECHFSAGRAGGALPLYAEALDMCRAAGDAEGVTAYLGGLFEVHRYLGRAAEAADAAAELSGALERAGAPALARRYRKLAGIVRRGEPLNRVLVEQDGVLWELDELGALAPAGKLRFVFCRNRISPARADGLVERGRALGAAGRYEEALAAFREAAEVDPHAPHPHHEEAVTLLHLERAAEAVACYDRVEALAPGWYHVRSERWLAAEIAADRIPQSVFMALRALEDGDLPPEEKVRLARRTLHAAPGLPALYLHLGAQLAALGRDDDARTALADGIARAREPGIRTRLLAKAATLTPPSSARDSLLDEAIALRGDLVSAAMAAVMRRAPEGAPPVH